MTDRQLVIILVIFADWICRSTFEEHQLIFVPQWKSEPAFWTDPDECLWDAPSDFMTKVPLKEIYTSFFHDLSAALERMEEFFRDTLKIDDIDWLDVIEELTELKAQQSITSEVARQLFGTLCKKSPTEEDDKQKMR